MDTINGETGKSILGNTRSNSINLKHIFNTTWKKASSSVDRFAKL
jgi:hypothetical protein